MNERVCRWGILGTAGIARKNWKAIRKASGATLTVVASRKRDRSQQFVADCQGQAPFERAPRAVGSYEELLASQDVDAVYIPLPTGLRKQWVIRAAEAGKHVLAEKPCGAGAGEVQEMLEACRRNGVQYMDGVMFMHSRRLEALRPVLDDGHSVGQIKRIASHFSFCASDDFLRDDIRLHSGLEPAGCLGDLGWYNLRWTLWVRNWRMPERVCGRILSQQGRQDSPAPVPVEFSGELFWPDGVTASFYCSFLTGHQQWANISGTHGYVHLPDFVLPYYGNEAAFQLCQANMHVAGCDFNMEDHTRRYAVAEYGNGQANAQETNMIGHFSRLALSGTPDPFWGDIALKTQQLLDACLKSAHDQGKPLELTG